MKVACLFALLGCLLVGCATTAPPPQPGQAQCLVCKASGDLACVNIPVEQDTPSVAHAGRTYYFCSDYCRADFVKQPAKFAAHE